MGVYIWSKLPSAYQEVEYIQSSGTQYIDTLFTPTPKTKISIDMQFTSTATQQRLFGVGTPSTSYMTFNAYINGSTQWSRAVQNGEGTWQSTGVSADTTRHIFELDNSTYKIYTNGTQVHSSSNSTTSTTSCSHSLPLLANYYEGGVYSQASAKLYGCKLWDNGTLVRNFIPCYRKSDSVIGLYDLVNNQFYTNSGTGTFSKGSDVDTYRESSLKNAYIGEVVNISSDLRGATLAGLQAQGWDGIATRFSSYRLDSTGLRASATMGDVAFLYKEVPSLNSNSIITIKLTGNVVRGNDNGSGLYCYTTSGLTFPSSFSSSLAFKFSAGTNATAKRGIVYNDSTTIGTTPSAATGGATTLTAKINLSTGAVEYNQTSPITHSTSGTLTSAQITNILTYKYIGVLAQYFSSDSTLYTVDLTIE